MTNTIARGTTLEPTECEEFYVQLLAKKFPLRAKILNGLQENNSEKFKFLPENGIRLLASPDVIIQQLHKSKVQFDDQLVNFVSSRAKRLFLILESIQMTDTISVFHNHNFNDDHLPIKLEHVKDEDGFQQIDYEVGRLDEITNKMMTDRPDSFNAFARWRDNDLKLFEQAQWQFLAPIFTGDPLHHNIHEKRPLPFISYDLESKTGFFGQVNQARIHNAHQKVSVGGQIPLKIAVKKLQRDAPGRFRREADSLDIISRLEHRHLIKPIASFQQGDDFCFLFPWADGGNLTQFWAKEKEYISIESQGDELLLWSLEQLCGLAGGLAELYNKNGRHGDLKPENILLFPDENGRGVLQITDMGVTKFHTEATRSRRHQTGTKTGTFRYEPPESEEDNESKPRSRDYDVWSMGCIYLEFLIWLLYGREEIQQFTRRGNLEHFWESRKHEYKIHQQVEDYMNSISEGLSRENINANNALQDLLNLIRTRLLKVKLAGDYKLNDDSDQDFNPDTRANAIELHKEISEIYNKAKNDATYIKISWTRPRRKGKTSNQLAIPVAQNQPRTQFLPPTRKMSQIEGENNPEVVVSADEYNMTRDRRLVDGWDNVLDTTFSTHTYKQVGHILDPEEYPTNRLCSACQAMNIWEPGFKLEYSASELKSNATSCDLCNLFYESIQGREVAKQDSIMFKRIESRFISGESGPTVLSIYYDVEKHKPSSLAQVGFPVLPRASSPQQITIFREWILACDENHNCLPKEVIDGTAPLPTRILDVGDSANPILRLVNKGEIKSGRYAALSHSWGNITGSKNYCTRKENFTEYRNQIDESTLPKTFRDAVQITRLLDVRYLWIDSLCIIQNDIDDWDAESVRMEDIFSSAYFTLAASSAPSSHAGFLNHREPWHYVKMDTPASGSIYLRKGMDDFEADVEKSVLSDRGWVLQERALSRRSLYFTSNQVYWECGDGVRCETLAKLRNSQAAFLGDSNFPNISETFYRAGKILLFQYLYKTYSRLSFTKPEDRPVAITGLERRLGRTYGTKAGYGIFDRYLGRGILWKCGNGLLKRIDFPATRHVPSWSWMAYQGGIDYLDISWDEADWTNDLKNPFEYKTTSESKRHWDSEHRDKPLELVADARKLVMDDIELATRVVFDELSKHDKSSLLCVVIGKKKQAESDRSRVHWVLVIKPVLSKGKGLFHERVGVGSLLGEHIKWDHIESVRIR